MKTSRRKMLSILAGVPIAGPLAAKLAGDQATADLAMINLKGHFPSVPDGYAVPGNAPTEGITEAQRRLAIKIPWVRDQIKEIFREDSYYVGGIDHDIANKRSWSVAAKVTFQRQRNIERKLDQCVKEYTWNRISKIWEQWAKGLLQ